MSKLSDNVRNRGKQFATRLATNISQEVASDHNPYLVKQVRYHGYDHLDLMDNCELSDIIFLLFRGELPNSEQRELFRRLAVALINPGIRHPATQASITAGVGKTIPTNVLPVALSIYGGEFDGAANVEKAMKQFQDLDKKSIDEVAQKILDGELEVPVGFGSLYGDVDHYAYRLLEKMIEISKGSNVLVCAKQLSDLLKPMNIGIIKTGICAATLLELGFLPKQGCGLMQLLAAPGLLAHGVEYADKPLASMFFETDDNYEIDYSEDDGDERPSFVRENVA